MTSSKTEDSWQKYRSEMGRYKKQRKAKHRRSLRKPALIFVTALLCVVGVFGVFALIGLQSGSGGGSPGGSQNLAPNFTLTDVDGATFSLSDFTGKVVILDLMGTTCIPCLQEVEELKTIAASYSTQVQLISVAVTGDSDSQIRQFATDHGMTWIVARDTNDVVSKYGARYIPTVVVINQNRGLAHTHAGLVDAATLSAEIDTLLGSKMTPIVSVQFVQRPKVRGRDT